MTHLRQSKGDGLSRFDCTAQHAAGVRLHTGGDVRRHSGRRSLIHPLNSRHGVSANIRVQAYAKEGIHQHVGLHRKAALGIGRRIKVLQRAARGVQAALHLPAVVSHFFTSSHEEGPDSQPGLQQQPGHGHAVAAVVSCAAEHRRTFSFRNIYTTEAGR